MVLVGVQDEVTAELRATEALAVLRRHAATRPLTLTFCKIPSTYHRSLALLLKTQQF